MIDPHALLSDVDPSKLSHRSSLPEPTEHPAISYYKQTNLASYPLILVVGREANGEYKIVNEVGEYDFDKGPRCGFWNASYSLVASSVKMNTSVLKKRCRRAMGSPIIYADLLPIGIPSTALDKAGRRNSIGEEERVKHIEGIFEHREFIDRVQLVLLSGVDLPVFECTRNYFICKCKCRSIPAVEVPFFSNRKAKEIRSSVSPDVMVLIKQTLNSFLGS